VIFSKRNVKKEWLKELLPIFWTISKFLSVFSIFYFFLFSGFFSVSEITIFGDKVLSEIDIYSDFFPTSQNKIAFLQTKKNIIFLNTKSLEKEILNSKSIVSDIKIEKKFPNTLVFTIKKSEPVLVLKFSSNDFLTINKFGFGMEVFREDEAKNLNLPILNTEKVFNQKFLDGKNLVIDPEVVLFVAEIKFFIENRIGSKVSAVNYDFDSKGKIFDVVLDEKISVKISLEIGARETIEKLAEVFEKIGKEKIVSVNMTVPKTFYVVCKNGRC